MAGKTADPQVGDTFGRLTIIDGLAIRAKREKYFRMLCICGNTKTVAKGSLVSGRSTSCGCWQKEAVRQSNTTHGKSKDPIYTVWSMMVQRCHLEGSKYYKYYGARGVTVCDSWRKFENFYEDMGDAPFVGATLDRIDNDRGYSKENCRWVDRSEQQQNTTKTVVYSFRGQLLSVVRIAELTGINVNSLRTRLRTYGMTIEDATSIPIMNASEVGSLDRKVFTIRNKRLDGHKLYPNGLTEVNSN